MRRGYDVHVQDSFFRVRGNYYVMFLLHKKRSEQEKRFAKIVLRRIGLC